MRVRVSFDLKGPLTGHNEGSVSLEASGRQHQLHRVRPRLALDLLTIDAAYSSGGARARK